MTLDGLNGQNPHGFPLPEPGRQRNVAMLWHLLGVPTGPSNCFYWGQFLQRMGQCHGSGVIILGPYPVGYVIQFEDGIV